MIGLKCDTLHMPPGRIYTDFICLFFRIEANYFRLKKL